MVEGKNDSVLAKFLLSGEDEDTPVQTIGTKAALESVETDDTKVQITPLESSNMFPKKSTERIEECITFPITTSTHFETARDFFEKGVGLINPELLPWIGKDNVFHYNTFKALVLQIVTFLAQNPCANLAKIHNMLVVIPKPVVECMLQNLVKSSLLIERKAISSVALKSPFQSKQLWNKQLTASLISTYSICI